MRLLGYTENAIFATGLRALLEPAMSVEIGAPSKGDLRTMILATVPDIVLVDSMRAEVSTVATAHKEFPELRIVAWINNDSPELSLQLLEAGAVALLQHCCSEQDLRDCMAAITRCEIYVPQKLGKTMWMSQRCKITPREGQLMQTVAQGLANKEIAWQLGISEGTVKVYLSRLFDKLGVSDRYELALLGLRNGAVETEKMQGSAPKAIYLKRRFAA